MKHVPGSKSVPNSNVMAARARFSWTAREAKCRPWRHASSLVRTRQDARASLTTKPDGAATSARLAPKRSGARRRLCPLQALRKLEREGICGSVIESSGLVSDQNQHMFFADTSIFYIHTCLRVCRGWEPFGCMHEIRFYFLVFVLKTIVLYTLVRNIDLR